MGIFDDVVINTKSAAQTVGKVAGQFVDMSKLRLNLSELSGEINKRYRELGRFIYEAQKAGSTDEMELEKKIQSIDDLYAQFKAVSTQLSTLQKKVVCPACGKQMPMDSLFCSHCGMKLNSAEKTAADSTEEETVETPAETPVETANDSEPASEE